jgi:hypothetical protein
LPNLRTQWNTRKTTFEPNTGGYLLRNVKTAYANAMRVISRNLPLQFIEFVSVSLTQRRLDGRPVAANNVDRAV